MSNLLFAMILAMILLTFATPTTQPSRERNYQVTLPDGWQAFENNNMQSYDLYITGSNRAVMWAMSEAKEDFAEPERALAQYAEKQVTYVSTFMPDAEVGEQKTIQLDGRDAIRLEVRGNVQDMKMIYQLTIIETPARVIAFTGASSPSRIEQHRPVFDQIIASTRDMPPTTQPAGGR